ncbi:MAG: DUF4255 domain-containing protein [Ginsengibacter sp.]
MSSALAIAGVTQVLKDLLNDGLINHDITGTTGTTVTVTSLAPDRIVIDDGISQLNLFMYQTTFNQGWRNEGQPSFNSRGDRVNNPPLALDLHYLLTAYGGAELHSEILLGYGMQLLHETPVLPRDAISRSLNPSNIDDAANLPLSLRVFSTSGLADQVEQIKIVPESMNTEELSKLWTAFGAKYRPSAAYKATVVLIESFLPAKTALPVQERKIYVRPFHRPVIEKIRSQANDVAPVLENQKILSGYNLVIEGYQLRSEVVKIDISGIEVMPAEGDITDSKIVIKIPDTVQPGIHGVQVIHPLLMGSPPELHNGVSSNAEAFILSPELVSIQVLNAQGSSNSRSADIQLNINPAIGERQKVALLLNELLPAGSPSIPQSYSFQLSSFPLLSPPGPVEDITVPVTGMKAGIYLIRIQADGVESPLTTDGSGRFTGPQIAL